MKQRFILIGVLLLAGCGQPQTNLDRYIAEVKKRPGGRVEPIPVFAPYETFVYAESGSRSPFEPSRQARLNGPDNTMLSLVKPPVNHVPQALENYAMNDLKMVGGIAFNNEMYALIRDSDGVTHRVKKGEYMGFNFGRVVALSDTAIELIEIVQNGPNAWVERPRSLEITVE